MIGLRPIFKTMEQEKPRETDLGKQFNSETAEEEIDRATIDSFLLEHPGVSEEAAKRELRRLKKEEKKQKEEK